MKLKEIAARLNVSPSAVSIVLKNKPGVSDATRKMIQTELIKAGYKEAMFQTCTPKRIRFLHYRKHGKIVADTPFFEGLIKGVETTLRQRGHMLQFTYIDEQHPLPRIDTLSEGCDGVLILATELTADEAAAFQQLKVPFVMLDSYFESLHCDTLVINNFQGVYDAVTYLVQQGHQQIGLINANVVCNNFSERTESFVKTLKYYGLEYREEFSIGVEPTFEGAYFGMNRFLRNKQSIPTAFFAGNDIIAIGAVRSLKEYGFTIPQDVSMIGFDDMTFAPMSEPPLTTIAVPKEQYGSLAAISLLQKIEQPGAACIKSAIGTSLVVRGSVTKLRL